jgi:hypothetical protein
MSRPIKKAPTKQDTHIYLEPEVHKWLRDSAKRNMRSITQEVTYLLQKAWENERSA